MITLISKWIVPITSKPIQKGAVVIDSNRIIDYGPVDNMFKKHRSIRKDLGNSILMPALTNAHTHLELSFLHKRMKRAKGFVDWARLLVQAKEQVIEEEIAEHIEKAIQYMHQSGISLIGEVSNSLVTTRLLAKSPLRGIIFYEIFGLKKESALRHFTQALQGRLEFKKEFRKSKNFRFSISPHSPQTVSPTLFEMIRRIQKKEKFIVSVHLSESPDEEKLIKTGEGRLKDYLEERNFWDSEWKTPGLSAVQYLDKLRFLSSKTLAVHCVQVDSLDIEIMKRRKVTVIICPRSNKNLKVGIPPLKKLLKAGIRVALGTDSLASNDDLNIFNEMMFVKREFPELDNEDVLKMATIDGAEAIGLGKYFGSIEKGKVPDLISINIEGLKHVKNPLTILTSGVSLNRISRHS